ncbi:unnamed protein product, partial [Scytosiphon promiscuus]
MKACLSPDSVPRSQDAPPYHSTLPCLGCRHLSRAKTHSDDEDRRRKRACLVLFSLRFQPDYLVTRGTSSSPHLTAFFFKQHSFYLDQGVCAVLSHPFRRRRAHQPMDAVLIQVEPPWMYSR